MEGSWLTRTECWGRRRRKLLMDRVDGDSEAVDVRQPGNGEAVEPGTDEVVKSGSGDAVERGNG